MSNASEAIFCGHCGERLPAFGASLGFCVPCARRFRRTTSAGNDRGAFAGAKDPLLALVLATVFPGAGQVYNGHFIKALLVFVFAPFVVPWLIGIADAYFSARRTRAPYAPHPGAHPA